MSDQYWADELNRLAAILPDREIALWPQPGEAYSATIHIPGVVLLRCCQCQADLSKHDAQD